MIPILFDKDTTVFTGNGIGRLSDAIDCKVSEHRNDSYELVMTYPMTGRYFNYIRLSSIIYAQPAPNKDGQAFRVYSVSAPINGQVTVSAEHISYQMNYIPVKVFSASNAAQALARLSQNAVGDNPFTFETDISKNGNYAMERPCSMKLCLGGQDKSILDVYKGEYEYDNWNVILHEARGTDKSESAIISYGKNLIDLTQEQNITDTYSAIMPYYTDNNNVPVYLKTSSGCSTAPIVYSEYTKASGNYPYDRIEILDMSSYLDKEQSDTQIQRSMYAQALKYIENNNLGVPKTSLSVEFADLKRVIGADQVATFPDLYLCDTVSVWYERLGISAKAKVIATEYNVLTERYNSIELGDEKVTLADQILGRAGAETAGGTLAISAIPENEIISIMRGEES